MDIKLDGSVVSASEVVGRRFMRTDGDGAKGGNRKRRCSIQDVEGIHRSLHQGEGLFEGGGWHRAQRDSALRSCEVECAYAPYLSRQAEEIEVWRRHGNMSLKDFDFEGLAGVIRNEQVEKLVAVRPETVQAASRISGVNASTIVLLVARQRRQQQKELGIANG